jgi:hypothetical protein
VLKRQFISSCFAKKPVFDRQVFLSPYGRIILLVFISATDLKVQKAAKHFEVRLRFLNEHVQNGTIEFARIDTKNQLADGFTKALGGPQFVLFRDQVLHSSLF